MDLNVRCGKVLKTTHVYLILLFCSRSTLEPLSNEKLKIAIKKYFLPLVQNLLKKQNCVNNFVYESINFL